MQPCTRLAHSGRAAQLPPTAPPTRSTFFFRSLDLHFFCFLLFFCLLILLFSQADSSALLIYFVALRDDAGRSSAAVMARAEGALHLPRVTLSDPDVVAMGEAEAAKEADAQVEPNRHATLFLYLNDNFTGGETVFPFADENGVRRSELDALPRAARYGGAASARPGMAECSRGLAVSPVIGGGALFYSKHGDGQNDPQSMHGGCPPVVGTKFGANAFCWNVDSDTGYSSWRGAGLL